LREVIVLAKVRSGAVYGVDAYPVEIEVNAGHGDPKIIIVGLPDMAVKESGDRVMTALINSGFAPPMGRTTINLAPADIKKEGPSFDLPIALGMIAAQGDIEKEKLNDLCVIGELALSGEVRRVRGVLPIAIEARAEGCRGKA
jgi:magnesium chelatase family protein